MIVSRSLNRLLAVAVFCLPGLGLAGCSGYKARLGLDPMPQQVVKERYLGEEVVNIAGGVGQLGGGALGCAVGGGLGAVGGGFAAVFDGTSIDQGMKDAASKGACLGYSIGAPVGRYFFKGAARVLVWGTPYAIGFTKWVGYSAYKGIAYVGSTIYNGGTGTKDPNIASYNELARTEVSKICRYYLDEHEDDNEDDFVFVKDKKIESIKSKSSLLSNIAKLISGS